MVPCEVFESRISANLLLNIWYHMLCNQIRHTISQDLEILYTVLILIGILNIYYNQIHPIVHFLPVTVVQKQEELSIYF